MHTIARIRAFREVAEGTEVILLIPHIHLADMIRNKLCRWVEARFDDGRHISAEQRKKAYATIRDISDYTGYLPEEQKEWLKYLYIANTGQDYFSLSDCSMDTAREYINTMLEYAIENGIPLSDLGVNRTDDVGRYLYYCIKAKKCCVCGKPGETHHVDRIGMGADRREVDDSNYKKMCLCREHHTMCHTMGQERFDKMHHVYGIIVKE